VGAFFTLAAILRLKPARVLRQNSERSAQVTGWRAHKFDERLSIPSGKRGKVDKKARLSVSWVT
jgi:hypothetical protein